jgi:short-subunit dehydrogenase involved in D-alanine esterification of teichoic acids
VRYIINSQVVLSRVPDGPLVAHIGPFAQSQSVQGYARHSICQQVRLAAAFSHWLEQQRIPLRQVSSDHLPRYLRDRAREARPCSSDAAALRHLLDFLRHEGVIAAEKVAARPLTAAESCVHAYAQYLHDARALAKVTIINYVSFMLHKNLKVPAADLDGLMAEVDINIGGVIRMSSVFIDILTANKGTLINVSSALAFVPLPSAPIYCATKSAVHAYTQSLRFQLEETGVEVIELMPPAVKTDLSADIAEGDGISLMTTDELVKQSFASLRTGALEIRPGQAKQLALMRRLAPDFINRQLWKASKKLVPVGLG